MSTLQPGFADPVGEAQSVFRAVLSALSRPGIPRDLPAALTPPAPLTPELAAVALALADPDAPIWLDAALAREPAVAAYLRFQTGAPIVSRAADAALALVVSPEALPPTETFALGTPDYPDRSTTIVLAVDRVAASEPPHQPSPQGGGTVRDPGPWMSVTGPGVKGAASFSASPLASDFADRVAANHALFPRGVDWLLVGAGRVLGLPRSSALSLATEAEAA